MIDEKQKEKNIKDLEYNHLLNKQNIFLILIGTMIISTVLSEKLPEELPNKTSLIFILFLLILVVLSYFSKKLNEKLEEIKNL